MKIKLITKSYNPFKMWGSWVGAGIGFLSIYLGSGIVLLIIFGLCNGEFCSDSGVLGNIVALVIPILVGFLLGWRIHSLIRRFRK